MVRTIHAYMGICQVCCLVWLTAGSGSQLSSLLSVGPRRAYRCVRLISLFFLDKRGGACSCHGQNHTCLYGNMSSVLSCLADGWLREPAKFSVVSWPSSGLSVCQVNLAFFLGQKRWCLLLPWSEPYMPIWEYVKCVVLSG